MSVDLEVIATIRSQTVQLILDVTAQPKPTYQIDGQSVSWESYLARLQTTVDWCDAKLSAAEPFEFATRGET